MNQDIKIIRQQISNEELRSFLGRPFKDMIKFVVDIKREVIALGGELHVDAEQILLSNGSEQKNLWGGNIYPDNKNGLEYESLINIRPSQNNRSMEIESKEIKIKIKTIIDKLINL